MSVEEDKTLFKHFLYYISFAAVVGLPLVVFIFKYFRVCGGESGWGKTSGHKSLGLSFAGIFPLLTVLATSLVLLQCVSDDEEENENTEGWRQFWCLMTALFVAAITKVISTLFHPKMQWWYCRKRMEFTKRTIRNAADVYLVVVSGWELICKLAEVSDEHASGIIAMLLPNHGLRSGAASRIVAIWGVLVLLEDLKRSMKDHDDAEKAFYSQKKKPSLKPYFTCINHGDIETYWGESLAPEVGSLAATLLGGRVSKKKRDTLLEYLTVNNAVTLMQLFVAALTGEGMILISCLIKMSSNSELEHDAFIELDEPEETAPTLERNATV